MFFNLHIETHYALFGGGNNDKNCKTNVAIYSICNVWADAFRPCMFINRSL